MVRTLFEVTKMEPCYYNPIPYKNGYAMQLGGKVLAQLGNGCVQVFATEASAWRSVGVHTLANGYTNNAGMYFTHPVTFKAVKRAQPLHVYVTPQQAANAR